MTKGYYDTVDEAKQAIIGIVNGKLAKTGVATFGTCPTGAGFGWDMMKHYALEYFRDNPPKGWRVRVIHQHECCDWTITGEPCPVDEAEPDKFYFLYTEDVHGSKVPLVDSETGVPSVFKDRQKAVRECDELNRETQGGYHMAEGEYEDH